MERLIAQDIVLHFKNKGWVWKFKDGTRSPETIDVEQMLDTVKSALVELEHDPEEIPTVIQGRLIVRKEKNNNYDVYMMVGTLGEDDD